MISKLRRPACRHRRPRAALIDAIEATVRRHDILRLKGFIALDGNPSRLVVQAVGPRVNHWFDRPWRDGESRRSSLVVIGLKGSIACGLSRNSTGSASCIFSHDRQRPSTDPTRPSISGRVRATVSCYRPPISELTLLARALRPAPGPKPPLRLANLMALGHHLSVDSWIERTGTTSRLIVVRLLGRGYWTYGVDELVALAARQLLQLALLPGGRDPDPTLAASPPYPRPPVSGSSLSRRRRAGQCRHLLRFASPPLLGSDAIAKPPVPLPHAGVHQWQSREPAEGDATAAIVVLSLADRRRPPTAPLIASRRARKRRLNPLPDLRREPQRRGERQISRNHRCCTRRRCHPERHRFAAGASMARVATPSPNSVPCLQVLFRFERGGVVGQQPGPVSARPGDECGPARARRADHHLEPPRSRKHVDWHAATECSVMTYRPMDQAIERIADLAVAWTGSDSRPRRAPHRHSACQLPQ